VERAPASFERKAPAVVVSKRPRGIGRAIGRALTSGALAMIFLVGAVQLIGGVARTVQSIRGDPGTTNTTGAAAPAADPAADEARAAAARFATDYLTYNPTTGGAWQGADTLTVRTVIPAAAAPVNGGFIVNIAALISVATPTAAAAAPSAPAPGWLPRSDPPDGFTVLGERWLDLQVPVDPTGHVLLGGAVFGTATPTFTGTAESDPAAANSSREWAANLFTAYAGPQTSLDYLTTEGATPIPAITGVTFATLDGWAVGVADPDGRRTTTATVTWALTGTTLTVTQRYTVPVTDTGSRWFATTISPTVKDTP
jgi:hypothetical protein